MQHKNIIGNNIDADLTAALLNNRIASLLLPPLYNLAISARITTEMDPVIIPMRGMVQSFNVSVTAAMFLFEVTRQRLASGKNFSIDEKVQGKLLKDFVKR